jgi:hypothetical protein
LPGQERRARGRNAGETTSQRSCVIFISTPNGDDDDRRDEMSRLVYMRRGIAPALGVLALAAAVAGCDTAAHAAPPAKSVTVHVTKTTAPAKTATPATTVPSTTPTTPTTPPPPATAVEYVAPVNSSGILAGGYNVSQTASGTCGPGSDSVSAAVYRCFYGNYVADPCWATKSDGVPTNSVLCLENPWSTSVVEVKTKGLLSSNAGPTNLSYPWGVKLTNGLECLAVQGAHGNYQGQDINYSCGTYGLELLGMADRSGAMWSFQSVNFSGTTFVAGPTVEVQTAWFAA